MNPQKIRITKIFSFETAHALFGYDGKCKNVHGHSYKLYVTLRGTPIEDTASKKLGMVIDFGDVKKIVQSEIVDKLDHAVLLNENSGHKSLGEMLERQGHKVVFTPYQPTCENMLIDFAERIKKQLPPQVELVYLKLYETENSYGEWLTEEN
uniref:6-pyruvoyl trahydropterin synthase family protein n=1 Tax=Ornithobacterium rhinotracheale TaxID=28251 RepID=UPI0039A6AE7C